MSRRIRLVDVFGDGPLAGNPLAVVLDADDLSTATMLEITRWLNFSETTFLLPPQAPGADYRVRIFTLRGELPFAGHPTLGTCHVWQTELGDSSTEIVQECGAGLVRLRRDQSTLSFEAPSLIREGPVADETRADVASILGIAASDMIATSWIDNGPGWVGVLLESADEVLALKPDFSDAGANGPLDIGVVGFHPEGSKSRYEVRAFFTGQNGALLEDPVTGSLNASVAQWLIAEGRVQPPYTVSQGTCLGRSGRISISSDDANGVWVGGHVFDIVSGEMRISAQT